MDLSILNATRFSESQLREMLCEIGRRIWQREYVAANDGNFSVKLSDDEILCTPTMVSKGFMKPEELPVVTPDGAHVRGQFPATSEIRMHLEIYRRRPDVLSVVHAHPPHATAFAVARQPIPKCVLPEIEYFLGEIPIAPYETPGTQKFAETLGPFLPHYNAFLLTNHGAVTVGKNPLEAYYRLESVEQYCKILLLAVQAGGINQFTSDQAQALWTLRDKMGMPDRRKGQMPASICQAGVEGETLTQSQPDQEIVNEIVRRVIARLNK
jgi:L-fuculose-phosphate aldolase